jgi:predicted AlkP superfamily phosphohydrolase/phosphomutase
MKVFVVGIDGATFDLIRPWAEQGLLPNFAHLTQQSPHGELTSTIPPVTALAWTSFLTGKNPGKHGIFDFIERSPDGYGIQYVNARSRKAKSLWRMLSEAGKTVCVVNVPMTYPPEEVNGCLIAGMDAPGEDSEYAYPKELKAELQRAVGGYTVDLRWLGNMKSDAQRLDVVRQSRQIEEQRTKATLYLMEKYDWDFFMVVFNATDRLQHYFWRHMDSRHPRHETHAVELSNAIRDCYVYLDEMMGRILAALPDDAAVMIMSDHGFGMMTDDYFFVNRWLEHIGLLKRVGNGRRAVPMLNALRKLDAIVRRILTPKQKEWILAKFPKLRGQVESANTLGDVDWSQTKAYSEEMYYTTANVRLNLKGREPHGIVEPHEADELLNFIERELEKVVDPRTGQRVFPHIYRREEIYSGDHAAQAADLLMSYWEDGAYHVRPSYKSPDGHFIATNAGVLPGESDWSGDHRMNGILIAHGAPFKKTLVANATLCDLTPTILHLMGLPVPDDVDGRVLTEMLDENYAEREIVFADAGDSGMQKDANGQTYDEEDAKVIEERLRGLGYMG